MSNLSRCRSEGRRAAKSIRYSSNFGNSYTPRPKIQKPQKTFLQHLLTESDFIILAEVSLVLPKYRNGYSTVHNDIFTNRQIRCDQVGLIYSPKKKMYYYLAINADNSCHILFKDKDVYKLPNVTRINLDPKEFNILTQENANRLMNSIFDTINDLSGNPIHIYKTSELFRK